MPRVARKITAATPTHAPMPVVPNSVSDLVLKHKVLGPDFTSPLSNDIGAFVMEVAAGLQPINDILQKYKVTNQQLAILMKNDGFKQMIREAQTQFNSLSNTGDRIRIKSQLLVEMMLDDLYMIMADQRVMASARVQAFTAVRSLTGLEKPEQAQPRQQFRLIINLPTGSSSERLSSLSGCALHESVRTVAIEGKEYKSYAHQYQPLPSNQVGDSYNAGSDGNGNNDDEIEVLASYDFDGDGGEDIRISSECGYDPVLQSYDNTGRSAERPLRENTDVSCSGGKDQDGQDTASARTSANNIQGDEENITGGYGNKEFTFMTRPPESYFKPEDYEADGLTGSSSERERAIAQQEISLAEGNRQSPSDNKLSHENVIAQENGSSSERERAIAQEEKELILASQIKAGFVEKLRALGAIPVQNVHSILPKPKPVDVPE